jgi:ribose 1,5-bisphosphokinase
VSGSDTMAAAPAGKIGPGALVLVVGPSGAGKDSLLGAAQAILADDTRIVFPRRAVTRESSSFENNVAISRTDFDRAVATGEYALWWCAHDNGYGIDRAIDRDIEAGKVVVVNVSRTIIADARKKYQKAAVVLITAPADVLAARLAGRGRDSDGNLGDRLKRSSLATEGEPDLVVSNVGTVEEGARTLVDFISSLRGA